MPFLTKIITDPARYPADVYPFNVPAIKDGIELDIDSNITFLVGENGSGKSTILEGIADNCGFNLSGGGRNHRFPAEEGLQNLSSAMKLVWRPSKVTNGFFLRAESFFNFASYIDEIAKDEFGIVDERFLDQYGGKSLHHQSHGESFFSLFTNQFSRGIYLLDEPEAALSPSRQFAFMMLLRELEDRGRAQFIIATHSPILLCYPGATIFSVEHGMPEVKYQDTEHYRFSKDFLNNPDRYLRHME
ncbi:AAA family ATPase [Hufsiella ginkgonis]|uniref:AAA family ATPase n=1 Tax=Hufsiella ginkgonis TaxID=2695274 RepID=A0A7K1XUB5_9SPHI|nr:AAA family ATPase [Hufsiella ginkgonis]MXV14572.1 AAA family ATPase [Hufsiella ginkgonis]